MVRSVVLFDNGVMQAAITPNVRLRPIALPSEHGGWGLLGAPILTGLIAAPSWAGFMIAIAGIALFLTRQPFRLALTDLRKGKRYPRTVWAMRFAFGYAAVGLVALSTAVAVSGFPFWLPLGFMAGLGGLQFSFDIQGRGRTFVPEVSGASALSFLTTAIVMAAGMAGHRPWLLALVLALQAVTAIAYAGARVRLARGAEVNRMPAWIGHVVALSIVGAAFAAGWLRWSVVLAFAVLTSRALWGLSPYRRDVRAAIVGIQEVLYTLLTVACLIQAIR